MKLKKMMAMLLVGATCVGMMAGCGSSGSSSSGDGGSAASTGSGDSGNITLIMASRDEFLSTLEAAATKAAQDQGYKLTAQDAQNDAQKQIQFVETAKNGGESAVIVNPVDSDAAQSVVDAAGDMPLVFVNRPPSDLHVLDAENVAFVGSNEDTSGYFQGEYLAEYFKAEGKTEIKYILLQGILGQVSQIKRCAGVLQALEDNGIKATPVVELAAEYDRAKAIDKISPVLTSGQEFDCIISNNDSMALGAVEACESAGITIDFPIVGIDCTKDGAAAVESGKMAMTVFQNPEGQGIGAVMACTNLIAGNPINEGTEYELDDTGESYSDSIIWVPFEPVTKDNVADYM
ncbi:sugar ABC transporter substrate-binding protein [Butyricicoccus sp.]|uniref:sugar ABC transporter substrate-binding protein n=1 Tax=Butyricicoccus sp. TaxID=2049021 RepID=UPI003F137223